MAETTAWLIERGQPEGLDHSEWWTQGHGYGHTGLHWGTDALAAIRFATKEDAESWIGAPLGPRMGRAVSHGFADG